MISAVTLTGCASIAGLVPSFWDDNQSAKIIDVRQKISQIDCTKPQLPQAEAVIKEIQWFKLYSESKGFRQNDVVRIISPLEETAKEWVDRSSKAEGSKTYCDLKKRMLDQQSKRAAEAILGRF